MQSKVHPTYKTKYRVANWPAYNQALVRRGDVTVWLAPTAIAAWTPRRSGCLRRSLLIGQLHLRGRRGKDRSRAPVDWSNERDLRDGLHHA